MSQSMTPEQKFAYILDTEDAKKILEFLKQQDWTKRIEMANDLQLKKSRASYLCRVLEEMGLINKMIVKRKAQHKLSQKGKELLDDIERRERLKKETSNIET